MESTNKPRTSRSREWERQRRNKFNDAIAKLGEIVKEIIKAEDTTGKDLENVQYPKVEIVQKAIVCLTNFIQEKAKLKAEILAFQVELEGIKMKTNTKEASTQAYLTIKQRKPNTTYMKKVNLQKNKRNTLKEKHVLTTNAKLNTTPPQILPKLFPAISNDKKSLENTIVVLPAAQYIFPPRPLLFPTAPPAIVLVDQNLQTLNKSILNRGNGDVTKTTMVNILPISAYSRPLSASKCKKNNLKVKKDVKNKTTKKAKSAMKVIGQVSDKSNIEDKSQNSNQTLKEKTDDKEKATEMNDEKHEEIVINTEKEKKESHEMANKEDNEELGRALNKVKENLTHKDPINIAPDGSEQCHVSKKPVTKERELNESIPKMKNTTFEMGIVVSASCTDKPNNTESSVKSNNNQKPSTSKIVLNADKDKENKLPHLLESTLCDSAVDGNACLELAEELLADSPKTAAYLMSFPLVSGNRVDSPAEETQGNSGLQTSNKETHRKNDVPTQNTQCFSKINPNEIKMKSPDKLQASAKPSEPQKYTGRNLIKQINNKVTTSSTIPVVTSENPFLNLPMPSLISTNCTISDTNFGFDYDCNISKSIQNQSTNYVSSNNFFYKTDPFSSVKNTIYSTSSISSSHDFNNLGLYPCAMEKYTSKTKPDYSNVEENLMKIGSSRLTYDIDLGWSHKSFDFVSCTTTSNTFSKDNILTTVSAPYTTTYNPFNPEFHVPLVSNSNKKENISSKSNTSFSDTITSLYSQPANLWSEEVPFYTNNNVPKSVPSKHQNYLSLETVQNNNTPKHEKHYEPKRPSDTSIHNVLKTPIVTAEQQIQEKFTKKSPSKMHINWMTSEIRPLENNCNSVAVGSKDSHKPPYSHISHTSKKHEQNESYFPISVHNFVAQPVQEEFQMWPSTRQVGPTEVTIEPPPINLPTLVGDLALGPHDKKKTIDGVNRSITHTQDIQNCGNFLSVTQLMNRSSDMSSRYQAPTIDAPKPNSAKQISSTCFSNDIHRKTMSSRLENQVPQPCYGFNDPKISNAYETMTQFSNSKNKTSKSDKSSKTPKSSYSAESLIRGGSCTQKIQDNTNNKFMVPSQKYSEFNTQDNSIAQVSHFPSMLDYADNSYASQQFSGTSLYNSTTNTISNSFYSNFMPGSSNLMSSNYTGAPFPSEFIDYNQTDCNYTNHKYEELKIRSSATVFSQDKVPSNYKSSRRESTAKHKLECSKKDLSKKYQSKRAKLNTEVDEWSDPSHILWQNKTQSKRHANLISEELGFPNYVSNQMPTQYQPEFINSHLVPSNVQSVGPNIDRSIGFPATSRANFNLSTIFPEITMKVQ